MNYISTLATFVSFMFAGAVFERYRQSRGLHLLFWALGAFYTVWAPLVKLP